MRDMSLVPSRRMIALNVIVFLAVLMQNCAAQEINDSDKIIRSASDKALPMIVICFSGAIGGLIMGIGTGRGNELTLPGNQRTFKLGFFGDMAIGGSAALAMLFVAEPLFGRDQDFTRLVALGIITGFAGIKVLVSLSEIPQRMIDESRNQLLSRIHDQDRARELIRQVESMLPTIDGGLKAGMDVSGDLSRAENAIAQVLSMVPNDPRALIVKGKIFRRKAEFDVDGKQAEWWKQAIGALNDALKVDAAYDRAYYNRACYHAKNGNADEALRDLETAIRLFAPNARFARDDADFSFVRNRDDFKKIVESV